MKRNNINEDDISGKIHEMIAQHNATPAKTFYYSEEEVKQLLVNLLCSGIDDSIHQEFEIWWENVKKK